MRLPLIKFNKIKEFLGKAPRVLAEKAFLTFLGLFFLALILGGFLFYKNVILVKRVQPEILEKPLQFNEEPLKKILIDLGNRKIKFEETEKKQYPDPFWGTISPPEVSPPGLTPTPIL